jgi:hypothetical protein
MKLLGPKLIKRCLIVGLAIEAIFVSLWRLAGLLYADPTSFAGVKGLGGIFLLIFIYGQWPSSKLFASDNNEDPTVFLLCILLQTLYWSTVTYIFVRIILKTPKPSHP